MPENHLLLIKFSKHRLAKPQLLKLLLSITLVFFPFIHFNRVEAEEIGEALTLKNAITIALDNNYDIKTKLASLPLAEAELIKAKYRPNPYLSSTFEFVNSGATHPGDIGIELELGKKRYWRIRAAKTEGEINSKELDHIIWNTQIDIRRSYIQLAIAQQFLQLAEQRKLFYTKLFNTVQARYEAGDVSKLDLLRAKVEYLTSEDDLYKFEENFNNHEKDFVLKLGFDPQTKTNITLDDIEDEKQIFKVKTKNLPNLEELQKIALKNRLDSKILEAENKKLEYQVNEAQWNRVPNLTLIGGTATTMGAWGPDIGAQMNIPLFTNGKGEIKELKAQLEQQKIAMNKKEFEIRTEVNRAATSLRIKEAQLERFKDEILLELGQVFDMINEAYAKGKYSITEVLVAEERNMDIKQRYFNSLEGYTLALIDFEETLGVTAEQI